MDQKIDRKSKISFIANPRSADKNTEILNDIEGSAYTGEVMGVIGPSGSGKSSLFDFLANQFSKQKVTEGHVFINNKEVKIN
ncbi:AB27G [Hepatospora eriocheir]|uniref:AB27G n=1 Tax=Hepatospora eriocheir TaxID=1081669 RepID=A0A1X0QHP4_9MICR|nr:AB27G [Hepatospora eriocheir]